MAGAHSLTVCDRDIRSPSHWELVCDKMPSIQREILQVVYADNVELHKDASHALQLPAGSGGEERSRSE